MPLHLYSSGQWNLVSQPWAYSSGAWQPVSKVWSFGYKNDGDGWRWREVWPGSGGTLPPGKYTLGPSSIFLPGTIGQSGYAEFDTVGYRGRITDVQMQVSWGNTSSFNTAWSMGVSGRTSGTFYRSVTDLPDWSNRTIIHNVASFNGNVVPQFNSGAAIGFGLSPQYSGAGWSLIVIGTVRLVLTIS